MSDGDAILAAILAKPEDDAPRLVYADWLEEFGGEAGAARGEFIRVQIELAKPHPCSMPDVCIFGPALLSFGPQQTKPSCGKPECWKETCRREPFRLRERELLGEHGFEWMKGFGVKSSRHDDGQRYTFQIVTTSLIGSGIEVVFQRGFLHSATCQTYDAIHYLDQVRKREPLRQLFLQDRPLVEFTPVVRTQRHDDQRRWTLYTATWEATCCEEQRRFEIRQAVTDREMALAKDEGRRLGWHMQNQVDEARTVEGYLKSRFEGIEVKLPTMPWSVNHGTPYSYSYYDEVPRSFDPDEFEQMLQRLRRREMTESGPVLGEPRYIIHSPVA